MFKKQGVSNNFSQFNIKVKIQGVNQILRFALFPGANVARTNDEYSSCIRVWWSDS